MRTPLTGRYRPLLRLAPVAVAAVLLAGCSGAPTDGDRLPTGPAAGDGGTSPFYTYDQALPPDPGVLLRSEDLAPRPEIPAGTAERILYSSEDGRWGSGVLPVSGTFYRPAGDPPPGGWPIVAWAHGTVGVADVCAPSWNGHSLRDATYIGSWLRAGYAVVAADYQGLGGPGPHPYSRWGAEGRSVLDAVRAVLGGHGDTLADDVVITGQSQGSGAAVGAARLAPEYAPEVSVRATIATGWLSTFPAGPVPSPEQPPAARSSMSYQLLRLIGGAVHDGGPAVDDLVNERGAELLRVARTGCLRDVRAAERRTGLDVGTGFAVPGAELARVATPVTDMDPVRLTMPLFVGTGLADTSVEPHRQYAAVAAACSAGSDVHWRTYPGITHDGIVNAAFADELDFVGAVREGRPLSAAPCTGLADPGDPGEPAPGIPFNDD